MASQVQDLLDLFWRSLGEVRTGMLGVAADDGRAQPMTAHFEGADGPIWFYARADSHLTEVAEAPGGAAAAFYYTSRDRELYAWVRGDLALEPGPEAAQRFWSEEVARWFPGGPQDPDLRVLRFDPSEAHLWRPTDGPDAKRFGFGARPAEDVRARAPLS